MIPLTLLFLHQKRNLLIPLELSRVMHQGTFPPPGDLWARYRAWKGLTTEAESIVLQDYFDDGGDKAPRYYQVNAINAAIEAIAKGDERILLVMATGTGKTYTSFQIIWRLWKAGRKKRILFLADRNVLIDQTMVNDFRPFGALLHGPEQIADLPVPVAESPGAVRIGHPERSHLVEYLAPNSVFNSLPRQRSSPHLRPDDRLVTIDRVLHHASLGVA